MHKKLLLAVFFIGLLLRVANLEAHPAGFTPDEASFGYDAYSLLKTGKDQWGAAFPINLKSFGDYKMPLMAYLTIPSVAIFGLTESATRLPNALLGSLAILATYFLVKEVFGKKTALFASSILAFSPWHIPMSRGAFEANLTTFLLPLALLFLFKSFKKNKFLLYSSVLLGINLFTYHSPRFVVPVLVLVLGFFYRSKLKKNKYVLHSLAIFLGLLVLAAYSHFTGAGARVASAGITSLAGNVFTDRFPAVASGEPSILTIIFNNQATYLFAIFIQKYGSYFSPQFLFTNGPAEGTYGMLPGRGVLYLFESVFLLSFLWGMAQKKIKNVNWLLAWLILAPIPAALSLGPGFAANRAAIMMPAVQIISALGAVYLLNELKRYKKPFILIVFVAFVVSFAFYTEDYIYQQPARDAKSMVYGAGEAITKAANASGGEEVFVSRKISEPHIFAAFEEKIDPTIFQAATKDWDFEERGLTWVDQLPEYKLANFTFIGIDWPFHSKKGKIIVGPPDDFHDNKFVIDQVYYPDKKPAYWIVNPQAQDFAFHPQ